MIIYIAICIIIFLGIAITYLAYRNIVPEPTDELDNIHIHFDMNKKVVEEIQRELTDYIEKNDARNDTFYREVTFAMMLEHLQHGYQQYLKAGYENRNKKLRHNDIENICNEMELHFHELLQLQREVNLRLKQEIVGH